MSTKTKLFTDESHHGAHLIGPICVKEGEFDGETQRTIVYPNKYVTVREPTPGKWYMDEHTLEEDLQRQLESAWWKGPLTDVNLSTEEAERSMQKISHELLSDSKRDVVSHRTRGARKTLEIPSSSKFRFQCMDSDKLSNYVADKKIGWTELASPWKVCASSDISVHAGDNYQTITIKVPICHSMVRRSDDGSQGTLTKGAANSVCWDLTRREMARLEENLDERWKTLLSVARREYQNGLKIRSELREDLDLSMASLVDGQVIQAKHEGRHAAFTYHFIQTEAKLADGRTVQFSYPVYAAKSAETTSAT